MTYAELVRKYHPEASDEQVMRILWDSGISIWQPLTEEDEAKIKNYK